MTISRPRDVLLFDLDGTLTDPYEGITRSFHFAVDSLGIVVAPDHDFRSHIGPPIRAVFETLCGPDVELQERALAKYRERFSVTGLFENRVYEGVPEMLARLQSHFRLFVCTSKPRVYAERIVDHFSIAAPFESVYGCELDGTRGNKGDLIRWLLEREDLSANDCVMIGDRMHDVAGAAANGMRSAGVLWGYGSPEELRHAGCDATFAHPDELTPERLHAIARA